MKTDRFLFAVLAVVTAFHAPSASSAPENKTAEREAAMRQSGDPESRRRADGSIQVEPKERRVHPYGDARKQEQVEKARQKKLESKSDKEAE